MKKSKKAKFYPSFIQPKNLKIYPNAIDREKMAEIKNPETGEVLIMEEKINRGKSSYKEYLKEGSQRGDRVYGPQSMQYYRVKDGE